MLTASCAPGAGVSLQTVSWHCRERNNLDNPMTPFCRARGEGALSAARHSFPPTLGVDVVLLGMEFFFFQKWGTDFSKPDTEFLFFKIGHFVCTIHSAVL